MGREREEGEREGETYACLTVLLIKILNIPCCMMEVTNSIQYVHCFNHPGVWNTVCTVPQKTQEFSEIQKINTKSHFL